VGLKSPYPFQNIGVRKIFSGGVKHPHLDTIPLQNSGNGGQSQIGRQLNLLMIHGWLDKEYFHTSLLTSSSGWLARNSAAQAAPAAK
jgi:hypothetical protein